MFVRNLSQSHQFCLEECAHIPNEHFVFKIDFGSGGEQKNSVRILAIQILMIRASPIRQLSWVVPGLQRSVLIKMISLRREQREIHMQHCYTKGVKAGRCGVIQQMDCCSSNWQQWCAMGRGRVTYGNAGSYHQL